LAAFTALAVQEQKSPLGGNNWESSSGEDCLFQGLLGGLLSTNMMTNPVFQAALRLFPALGGIAGSLPAVATWFAARWDGAVRPLLNPLPARPSSSPSADPLELPPGPASQLLPASSSVSECSSSRDAPLLRTVTTPLASSSFFTALLGPMPSMGRAMRALPLAASWYASLWDTHVRPFMEVAMCRSSQPPRATTAAALAALRNVAMPVVRHMLATNTGVILSDALWRRYGFDTSTLDTYLAATHATDLVQLLQGLRPSSGSDYDYGSLTDLGLQQLLDALSLVYGLLTPDPRFTVAGMVLDVLSTLQHAAEGPNPEGAASRRRLQLGARAPDPGLEALFAMSGKERKAFTAFAASVAELRLSMSASMATLGLFTAPPARTKPSGRKPRQPPPRKSRPSRMRPPLSGVHV
ncbi:hypothetical protein TSOC_009067, partial [Tetrabaena socialis]